MKEKPPNNIAVGVENLEKKFGDFTAVNKINFQVGEGEIFSAGLFLLLQEAAGLEVLILSKSSIKSKSISAICRRNSLSITI